MVTHKHGHTAVSYRPLRDGPPPPPTPSRAPPYPSRTGEDELANLVRQPAAKGVYLPGAFASFEGDKRKPSDREGRGQSVPTISFSLFVFLPQRNNIFYLRSVPLPVHFFFFSR